MEARLRPQARRPLLAACAAAAAAVLVTPASPLAFALPRRAAGGSADTARSSRIALRARSLLDDITSDKRPFLLYEENRPAKRKRLNAKQKRQRALEAETAKPPPVPSVEPKELMRQLRETKRAQGLISFLRTAQLSPAFTAMHAALALDILGIRRPSFKPEELSVLGDEPTLQSLAEKGPDLFQAAEQLPVGLSVSALKAIAVYIEDVPKFRALIDPVARHILQRTKDMQPNHVADIIWTIAELRDIAPGLQNSLLPHFVELDPRHRRIKGLHAKMKIEMLANVRNALHKLRRDVPQLREVLNVP